MRRAGLGAGRTLADGDAIGAQRALVGLVVDLGDARDVERASPHAIAAADAVLVHEVDDAVGVLHDRAGRRAGLEAARILAMHAAVLADQPFEILRLRVDPFGEAHQREHFRRQVGRIVVDAGIDADLGALVVPFEAGRLAGLAADAFRHVDELGHRRELARRRRHRGGRAANQIGLAEVDLRVLRIRVGKLEFECHGFLPYATGPAMGSISTRNALYSGVSILASPT